MTRWTITHRGVPLAAVEAESPEHLGAVVASPLPAFELLRPSLPGVWRATSDGDSDGGAPAPVAAIDCEDLELQDEWGSVVATKRMELVVTGPRSAVAFIAFDTAAAAVGARVDVLPRGASAAAPEA